MNIDLKKLEEYKKADSFARVYFKLLFPLIIFEVVIGIGGMIATIVSSGNQDTNGFLLGTIIIIMFVSPTLTFIFYFPVQNYANKKFDILRKELFDSKMLAEDILKLGEENDIDLINVAIAARCIHELGWKHVPEEYAKDRILPDKKK